VKPIAQLVTSLAAAKTLPKDAAVPPERFVASLDLGRKGVRPKVAPVGVAADKLIHGPYSERRCRKRLLEVFGEWEMSFNGTIWVNRVRSRPSLMREILGEIAMRRASGTRIRNPAAYAERLWRKALK
jgi:hypothetical protein